MTRPLVGQNKSEFDVMPQTQDAVDTIQKTLLTSLRNVIPSACVFKGIMYSVIRVPTRKAILISLLFYLFILFMIHFFFQFIAMQSTDKYTTQTDLPVDEPMDQQEIVCNAENYYLENMVKNSVNHVFEEEVNAINKLTWGQSTNPLWKELRKGRLTASNFYAIHTKVLSFKKNANCDIQSLLSQIMGYKTVNPNVKSLKYGREMEPIAKSEFIKMYRKCHDNVSFDECGLFLDEEYPYLAASPDLLVSCSCCGEGLVEFKCPLIPKCSKCLSFCKCKLPYCLQNSELLALKHGAYYGQIQGQLSFSKRKWCILYIYTCNGPYQEKLSLIVIFSPTW